jgi:N6-adenosine-specific RNA methylase IME4
MYKVIVADPPWSYRNTRTGGSLKSGSKSHYDTMHISDIARMPIEEIVDQRGSILFLWATVPLLDEAMEVMKMWGFQYKGKLTWIKIGRLGMGYWFRGAVEDCLFGVRGKVPAFHCQHSNVIAAKPRHHSQKPEEFWELIEPYCAQPRLELFCRGSARHGWDGWGHDCEQDVPIPQLDDYMQSIYMEQEIAREEREIQEEDTPAPPRESPLPKVNLDEITDEELTLEDRERLRYKGWDVDHI